jgi:hypothetical protein
MSEEVARKAAELLAMYETEILPVYIPEERQLPAGVAGGAYYDQFNVDDDPVGDDGA